MSTKVQQTSLFRFPRFNFLVLSGHFFKEIQRNGQNNDVESEEKSPCVFETLQKMLTFKNITPCHIVVFDDCGIKLWNLKKFFSDDDILKETDVSVLNWDGVDFSSVLHLFQRLMHQHSQVR